MSDALAGRRVLVTGASSGIGRALTEALVARGATVIAAARSTAKLAELAETLGPTVVPVTADVTDAADVARLVAVAEPLDALVNNAGIGHVVPFVASDAALWQATLETNLVGPLRLMHAVLPAMLAAGRGVVVNVGSASASGWPYLALYAASKSALQTASLAIDREIADQGVRVLHVVIGPTVGTEFGFRSDPTHLPAAAQVWTALDIPWNVDMNTPADSAAQILDALVAALR